MEATTFVLFGATGDLAKRKIYPALYNLFLDHKLSKSFTIIGLGRREWSDEAFQAQVEQSLHTFSRRSADDSASIKAFIKAFRYSVMDVERIEDYHKLLQVVEQREQELHLPGNRMFYLSVGPEFFGKIAASIQESGLGSAKGWKRLIIEKPFGHDLKSAQELNQELGKAFKEEEIFRIDHYLGKPMVQKLDVLEQSNPALQDIWTNQYIANVQITASETVGVEERAGYYDHVGAIRDMFQNHMLQLLMTLGKNDGRISKRQVMESVEPLLKENVVNDVVRGQYTAGSIQGKPAAGYKDEPGIDPCSTNDTFVAVRLRIDDVFWRDIPIYIRTGKRMKEKSTRIVIEFKQPFKRSYSAQERTAPNLLIFEISPNEGVTLQINHKDLPNKGVTSTIPVDLHFNQSGEPEAYENLIYDALQGDPTFFAHWDEVELAWKWVQPILEAFEEDLVPLHHYPAGTYGPDASDLLLAEDGNHWWFDSKPVPLAQRIPREAYA
ncbi:glucose-6-phosphate dehydrogenase [Paenibacillus sepulcri]|uniref:Glucose-6-phosphate 1-dehydrogenase n=1 Tax=Paenibacillus sepulcri TaxID=359917 RepID=A0ABS7BXA5_9BACL|nr:glucose-6-phosphate dehydrogenase [Paenibacillus sepulcri]